MFFLFLSFLFFPTQQNDNMLNCRILEVFLGKGALPYIGLDVHVYVKLNFRTLKG